MVVNSPRPGDTVGAVNIGTGSEGGHRALKQRGPGPGTLCRHIRVSRTNGCEGNRPRFPVNTSTLKTAFLKVFTLTGASQECYSCVWKRKRFVQDTYLGCNTSRNNTGPLNPNCLCLLPTSSLILHTMMKSIRTTNRKQSSLRLQQQTDQQQGRLTVWKNETCRCLKSIICLINLILTTQQHTDSHVLPLIPDQFLGR